MNPQSRSRNLAVATWYTHPWTLKSRPSAHAAWTRSDAATASTVDLTCSSVSDASSSVESGSESPLHACGVASDLICDGSCARQCEKWLKRTRWVRTGAIHLAIVSSTLPGLGGSTFSPWSSLALESTAACIPARTPPQPVWPTHSLSCQFGLQPRRRGKKRTADDDGFDLEDVDGVGEGGRGRGVTRVEALRDVALQETVRRQGSACADLAR